MMFHFLAVFVLTPQRMMWFAARTASPSTMHRLVGEADKYPKTVDSDRNIFQLLETNIKCFNYRLRFKIDEYLPGLFTVELKAYNRKYAGNHTWRQKYTLIDRMTARENEV